MNFSYYIAKRYLFSSGGSNAINIITGIAAVGVVIGAMSLFLVLSGFSGLKDFSLQFSSYFDPDLKVFPSSGKTFAFTETQQQQLEHIEGIAHFSEVIEERVFLAFKDKQMTAHIKGVDTNYAQIVATDSIIVYGNWLSQNNAHVVVGNGISRELSMGVEQVYSDLLNIYVPKPGKSIPKDPSKAFSKETAANVGVYSVSEDLDKKYVFATIGLARELLSYPEHQLTHLELKLTPNADHAKVTTAVQKVFKEKVYVKNRMQLNDKLYKMLNTENLISYLVITLIAVIALFNVAGAIIMMVIDKKENIKTLYNLGASLQGIRNIFLLQGLLMTLLGTVLGLILGSIVILLQQHYGLLMITPTLMYPTEINLFNYITVFFTIVTIGSIASFLASSSIRQKLIE